jgi:hypothetical protein
MTNGNILRRTLAELGSMGALLVSGTFGWLGCDTATGLSDDERLIQTESLVYELHPDWIGLSAEIPYTFTNRTGRTVYLGNCNGAFSILLEREDEDGWKTAWAPWRQTCLSSPIVIEAHTVFHDTLHVWGAPADGTNVSPHFDQDDPSSVYRIVWGTGLWSYDESGPPFGTLIRLDWRVSNRFTLQREAG